MSSGATWLGPIMLSARGQRPCLYVWGDTLGLADADGEDHGRTLINGEPRRSGAPLVLTWLAAAIGLGLLLALARVAEGPLDDPDQAWQRPGYLDAGDLPAPSLAVAPGIPLPGRPTVVFFLRPENSLAELCQALAESSLLDKAVIAMVVVGSPSGRCDLAAAVVGDADAGLGDAYGIRRPRGGGPPVGYAVVDAAGAIRYRTLDPDVSERLREVTTIVSALR